MPSAVSSQAASLSSQSFRDSRQDERNEDDQVLSNEVVAVLSELGHYNRITNTYQLNVRDQSSCLRDLIRYLRHDGSTFLIRRQMGMSNIVNNDLLPIVEQHTVTAALEIDDTGKSIMDKVVRLLVDLTNPTILHYKDQRIPKDDKHEMQIYLEMQNFLYSFKIAFAVHKRFWIVLSKHITRILELEDDDRQVEDGLMMERIIVLIRNVLHIPMMSGTQLELDGETNVQDRLIEHMNNSGILDIVQYMLSSGEHQEYCFHLIEIMFLMFREQNAEFLAKSVESDRKLDNPDDDQIGRRNSFNNSQLSTASSRSQYERDCDRREFEEARQRDHQEYLKIMEKCKADDFTRFTGSSFVIKNMKSISERDMICHRAYLNPATAIDLNRDKVMQRKAQNRRPMEQNASNSDALGGQRIHRSNRKLRSIMYDFCSKFLSDCYNDFMATIKSHLSRGSSQDNDQTYYLWAVQFFMEFSRSRDSSVTPEQKYRQIYETMATSTFHYLQTIVDDYLDKLQMKKEFKNEFVDWSKRLHFALRAYRELLFSLASLERLRLPEASKMCHRIKTDIFTEPEYRELLLRLLQGYLEERMSKAYLRDLIETNHIFLKMLDYHSKISFNFKVKVKKRKQKRASKKKKNKDGDQSNVEEAEPEIIESPDDIWMDIIGDVSDMLASSQSSKVSEALQNDEEIRELFDPLTEKSLDEQKLDIMRKICKFLRQRQIVKAIGLFREARSAMTGIDEDNVFGDADIGPDDELLALNEIMMTEFPEDKSKKKKDAANDEEEEDDDEEDELEQFGEPMVQEKDFSLEDTLRRYAHPNVVRAYRLLLKNYRTNSPITNHSIARMLHRIAVELKMIPMFYNLGYFVIFERILEEPSLRSITNCQQNGKSSDPIKELATFSHYVLRNFFKLLNKFPNIAAEILFIVNSRDAYSMEYGFEPEQVAQLLKQKKTGGAWTDVQQLELEVLYKEYKERATKEKDVVDLIQEHLIDDTKTRRQIIAQLKKMDILEAKDIKKNSWKGPAWSNEELSELEQLYHRFKDNLEEAIKEIEDKLIAESENNVTDQNNLTTTIEQVSSQSNESEQNGELGQLNKDEPAAELDEIPKDSEVTDSVDTMDNGDSDVDVVKKKPKSKKPKIDIIECILRNLSSRDKRNRRQIIRQLKSMNIYDHSAVNKWSKEQIENLREVFCDIFVDFKEHERETAANSIDENNENDSKDKEEEEQEAGPKDNSEKVSDDSDKIEKDIEMLDGEEKESSIQISKEESLKKFDFPKLLMERFSDKTKSYRQILRQLKKMGFENNLKTIGVFNKNGDKSSRVKESMKTFYDFGDDDSDDESEDDNNRDDLDDEEDNDDNLDDKTKENLKKRHRRNPFDDIVVQYDDSDQDGDEDSENHSASTNGKNDDNEEDEMSMLKASLIKQKKERTKRKLELMKNSRIANEEDFDKSRERRTLVEENDGQEEEEEVNLRIENSEKKKKRNVIKLIDSDSEDDEAPKISDDSEDESNIVDSNRSLNSSRRIVLDSDSEDDDEPPKISDDSEDELESTNSLRKTAAIDSDLDDDFGTNESKNMDSKLVNIDDEEEELQQNRIINNKRKLIDSENEDEEEVNFKNNKNEEFASNQKKKRFVIEDDDDE